MRQEKCTFISRTFLIQITAVQIIVVSVPEFSAESNPVFITGFRPIFLANDIGVNYCRGNEGQG
jgi:hypothetical protein